MTPKEYIKNKRLNDNYLSEMVDSYTWETIEGMLEEYANILKSKKKPSKSKMVSFEESDIYDKVEFKAYFPTWPVAKLKFYYNAADNWSNQGNKYINWGKAINNWADRDDAQKKYIWPKDGLTNKNNIESGLL